MLPILDTWGWAISCALLGLGLWVIIEGRLVWGWRARRLFKDDPNKDPGAPAALLGGPLLILGVLAYPVEMGHWRWAFIVVALICDDSIWFSVPIGLIWMAALGKPEPRWVRRVLGEPDQVR